MPDHLMPTHAALSILRGQSGVTSPADRDRATRRAVAEIGRLQRIEVWARRVLDAPGDETAARGLRDALDR